MDNQEVRQQVARAEALLAEVESLSDIRAKSVAIQTVQTLFDLYGEGLARLLERCVRLGDSSLLPSLLDDELIAHLLLMHGLHPVDLETRVQQALDEVRPYLQRHAGSVELLGLEAGVARLRLLGNCQGCPSSATTLKMTVERAIQKAAPDLLGIETVDGDAPPVATTMAFIPICDLVELESTREND